MEKRDSETLHILKERNQLSRRLFFEGLLVGGIAGFIAIVYRLLLTNAESLYFSIVHFVKGNLFYIFLWLIGLVLLGLLISVFLKYEPYMF